MQRDVEMPFCVLSVCCVRGSLCSQGEDGFPGIKGDFGGKGERVRSFLKEEDKHMTDVSY